MQSNKKHEVSVQDRVAFVNLADGKVFFDCRPSEARAAMKAVEEIRKSGSSEARDWERACESFKSRRDRLLGCPLDITSIDVSGDMTISFLNHRFSDLESMNAMVDLLILNAEQWGTIRDWGHAVYDAATRKEMAEMELFGHIFTADVAVTDKLRPGEMILAGHKLGSFSEVVRRYGVTFKTGSFSYETIRKGLGDIQRAAAGLAEEISKLDNPGGVVVNQGESPARRQDGLGEC